MNTEYNLPNQRIQADIFPRIALKCLRENSQKTQLSLVFSISHNNIVSINCNLENVELLLDELDFHFDATGISETKIKNSNECNTHPSIAGYSF